MLPATDPKKVYDLTKVRRFVRELLGFLSHILNPFSNSTNAHGPVVMVCRLAYVTEHPTAREKVLANHRASYPAFGSEPGGCLERINSRSPSVL